jgi:hypothetical protein
MFSIDLDRLLLASLLASRLLESPLMPSDIP